MGPMGCAGSRSHRAVGPVRALKCILIAEEATGLFKARDGMIGFLPLRDLSGCSVADVPSQGRARRGIVRQVQVASHSILGGALIS